MDQEFLSQTALDQMVSDDRFQMLKAAVPYLPPAGQQLLSVYAKAQELQNTLALFSPRRRGMQICAAPSSDPMDMLRGLRRFAGNRNREMLDQMTNLFVMLQMAEIMQEP